MSIALPSSHCSKASTILLPQIAQTADIVREISVATREQSIGTDEISDSVAQLDGSATRSAEVGDTISKTARQLSLQAKAMEESFAAFTLDEDVIPKPEDPNDIADSFIKRFGMDPEDPPRMAA